MNPTLLRLLAVTLAAITPLSAQVTINEIAAAPNERALRYDATGQPRLGSGPAWFDTAYDSSAWLTGAGPLGFNAGNTGLGTNLKTTLEGNTASLYVRKVFTVSAGNAASTENLRLNVNYNDGFVAFLNGKEIARARLGAARMFVYADQPAFSTRPATPAGAQVFNLGAASSLLVAGTNVLAIQVANAAWDGKGDLIIDAGLELNNGILTTTEFSENFNNANGSSRNHSNVAGSISNTTTGTPPAGWLANAADPTSAATWNSITINQLLDTTGGSANGGNLRVNLTGTGPTQLARVLGPAINMATQWPAGAVTEADLDNTTVTFKYKAPGGFSANVKLEPVGGSAADALSLGSLTGSSVTPTSDVTGWWRFENHIVSGNPVAGTNGATISNAPSVTNNSVAQASLVTANAAKYSTDTPGAKILDPITGAVYDNTFSFDATLASARFSAPNDAIYNTPSFTVEFFIKLSGEPTGFDSFMRRIADGPGADSATVSDRQAWQVDYDHGAAKTGFGKVRSRWDTVGTSPSPLDNNRVSSGNYLLVDNPAGDGNPNNYGASADVYTEGDQYNDAASNIWHHVAVTYDGATKRVTIYTDYVAGGTFILNNAWTHPAAALEFGKFSATSMPAPASTPWPMKMDEVRYSGRVLAASELLKVAAPDASGYTVFTTKLSAAAAPNRTAFLAALNGVSGQAFRPAFELVDASYAASPGKDMRIDDFSVTYDRQTPITPFFGLGSTFSYKPGLSEPSNGVAEPNLPKVPNNPSEAGKPAAFPDLPGFADWVELKNSGASAVNLTGWYLTDNVSNPTKWAFPAGTSIPAGGYLLVLCDENDTLPGLAYLHTNFKLSEGGEKVALFNGSTQVDLIDYPRQNNFVTYGRGSSSGALGYFDVATPGEANLPMPSAIERCKTPDFFSDIAGTIPAVGGFYTGSQTLVMNSTTPGSEIRYTTDGTEPTETSTLYTGPITVTAAANDKTARVYRARAFKAGSVASGTKSATFLIDQNAALKGVPAMVFTGDGARTFYKDYGVMAINGGVYDASGVWSEPNAITDYSFGIMHGRAFERPLFLEWLRNDGQPGFSEDAGVRIASSPFSRPRLKLTQTAASPLPANATEKPSFNLFFREDYGNSQLNYPFLGQDYPVNTFDELRPRAGKNDISNPFIKDELVRRMFRDMGRVSVQGNINTLYINGVYKGFFNTVERYRDGFFDEHYGVSGSWDIRIIDTTEEGDNLDWNAMIAAVQQDLTIKANYDAAMAKIDLDEVIDYYLLNIYLAMWDWPNNNWVGARQRVPEGRWRLHVWDGEGSFGHGGVKPPNYDTILTDLRATTGGFSTSGINMLFRGIYASPEVKLRVADRINKWYFNGQTLDDRTPATSRIATLKNQMTTTFAPLLLYTHGTTYSDAFFNNWTTATTANPNAGTWTTAMSNRRSHLFNTSPTPASNISFRTHGLWPATEPVTFSQHGGNISAGYNLTISTNGTVPAGSTIYYTLNGTDPRVWGGSVAAGIGTYTAPITLPGPFVRVSARVKNGTTGEWSALTEADFLTDTQPATASNLVVSQIHYHPANPSPAEVSAGYTSDDEFEFIELMAIGGAPVDLTQLQIISGVTFDFAGVGAARVLLPGERVLIVKNLAAFQMRYGNGFNADIAGTFLGTLSNSGEQISITGADGPDVDTTRDDIKVFTYADSGDWPSTPDGNGPSLVLMRPETNPLHSNGLNWRASSAIGGTPNASDAFSYSAWATANSITDTVGSADTDGDGLTSIMEYFLGANPNTNSAASLPVSGVQSISVLGVPGNYLTLTYTRALGRDDVTFEAQTSTDLTNAAGWTPAVLVTSTYAAGNETRTCRFPAPTSANTQQYMRVKVVK